MVTFLKWAIEGSILYFNMYISLNSLFFSQNNTFFFLGSKNKEQKQDVDGWAGSTQDFLRLGF